MLAALMLCALLLTGCGGAGAPPDGVSAAVFTVVTAVWKRRNMGDDRLLRDGPGDTFVKGVTAFGNHVKFFLRLRAEAHLKTDGNTDRVADSVTTEYDTIRRYVAERIGNPGSPTGLVKGTDKSPPHLDLNDVLRPMTSSPNPVNETTKLTQELKRWERANSIIWRAAAIESRIWDPNFSTAAMDELLDRRLRMLERLWYQIDEDATRGTLLPRASLPEGPWLDGARVRMFEYPELSATPDVRNAVGAANIGPGRIWREEPTAGTLVYAKSNVRWATRIRNAAAASFTAPPPSWWGTDYGYTFEPTSSAKAIDDLFTPSENWWDRSWIFCDEVLAALHLESLRFGKLRRLQDNDASFNSALASHPNGWAGLRPVIGGIGADERLIADDDVKPESEPRLFSNGAVPHVQLGDHVVFWNSIMYGLFSNGAWSLENAVIVDLTSDWASNDYGDKIWLMGHGTAAKNVGQFKQGLVAELNEMIVKARAAAKAAPAGVDNIPWVRQGSPLVRWAPYGEPWIDKESNQPLSPWWIRIPYAPTADWVDRALGRDATRRTLPDAIEADPAPSPGYTPPPAAGGGPAGACYFPLWVPTQNGRWKGYLERRKAGQVGSNFELERTIFSGDNIPSLVAPREFVPGEKSQHVYAARPYVTR